MNDTFSLNSRAIGFALAATALVLSAQPATAQAGQGPGWSAWLGCWQPVSAGDPVMLADGAPASLCFLPADDASHVELVTVEGSEITGRQLLDASGASRPVEREGCSGVESMEWSDDGQRVYQRSTYDCPGALQREVSGAFIITPQNEWVDVAAVRIGEDTNVRVTRYRPARAPERNVTEVARALEGRAMAMETARAAAATRLRLADVVEASRRIDAAAIEGWLIESGQNFEVDRERLVELSEAGVSDGIIDLMVALSYPDHFAIDRVSGAGERLPGDADVAYRPGGMMDPWGYGSRYGSYYRGGFYPGYFYSDPYSSRYYGGGYGGGWYTRPVIVVREPEVQDESRGSLVNGRGYTRGDSGRGTSSPSGPRNSAGRSGSSDGSASSGGSSGSSGTSGRTAKPRE